MNPQKVLFAYPPSIRLLREDRCQIPAVNTIMSPSLPPMDLLYMAAVAEQHGAVCKIADYTIGNDGFNRFFADLKKFRPSHLVITVATPTLTIDLQSAAAAKTIVPDVKIIAKGAHFLVFDSDVFDMFPHLDMAIYGEPEQTLLEILSGSSPDSIDGLIYRKNGHIVRNKPRNFINNIDSIPFPARHLIDNSIHRRPDNGKPVGVIKVSRGCPHHCFFCLATPLNGPRVRMRTPENIVDEITECVEQYGIKDFLFWSDLFNADKHWVLSLCDEIVNRVPGIRWSSNARASNVDKETATAMKAAGCELVSIGVESGNQDILIKLGKGTTLDQIRDAFSIFREAGIKTLAYYLFGLPWETNQTAEETIRFSLELDSDLASFFIATPLPGTRFYEYAVKENILPNGSDECTKLLEGAYHIPSVQIGTLPPHAIASIRRKALRKFYLRPGYAAKVISSIRSTGDFLRYTQAAANMLFNLPKRI